MKRVFPYLLLTLFLFSCSKISSPKSKLQKAMLGEWRLIATDIKDPIAHRNIVFNADGTFYSELIRDEGQRRLHNSGRYWIISDSSIVTLHDSGYQRHSSTANVYYVTVDGPNLYIKGYHVYALGSEGIAHTVYLDEHWVRE